MDVSELNEGLEKTLGQAVKLYLGLSLRFQDVIDARAMGHLLRKVANRE